MGPWAPVKFIKMATPKKRGTIQLFSSPKPDTVTSNTVSPPKPSNKRTLSPDEKTPKKWKGTWQPKINKGDIKRKAKVPAGFFDVPKVPTPPPTPEPTPKPVTTVEFTAKLAFEQPKFALKATTTTVETPKITPEPTKPTLEQKSPEQAAPPMLSFGAKPTVPATTATIATIP